ncbi:hypothetical protein PT974_07066 [Cladobotryum mycophilum]|uniref:Uncharacterized protein n=1 Tax=Cladobotryum mycophilum TaxID=491253 RepID=A0ABR0SPC3_9HYPO
MEAVTGVANMQYANFKLNPIERNARRQYKRIAILVKFLGDVKQQIMAERLAKEVFPRTVQVWPVLVGKIRLSTTDKDGLTLSYPIVDNWEEYWKTRNDLVEYTTLDADSTMCKDKQNQVTAAQLDGTFFSPNCNIEQGDGISPVALKVWMLKQSIVLGFSFCEVLFDNEYIRLFLQMFHEVATDAAAHRETIESRLPLTWDWRRGPGEKSIPQYEVVGRIVRLAQSVLTPLMRRLRAEISTYNEPVHNLSQICVISIFWIRAQNTREYDKGEQQFGNYTVPVMVSYKVRSLIQNEDGTAWSLGDSKRLRDEVSRASKTIHEAIRDSVNNSQLATTMLLQRQTDPTMEGPVLEGLVKRRSCGIMWEDWTNIVDGTIVDDTKWIPESLLRVPTVYPCVEDMEEGQVILLPRRDQTGIHQWPAWLGLCETEMEMALAELREAGLLADEEEVERLSFVKEGS